MRLNLAKNTFIWLNKISCTCGALVVQSWCTRGAIMVHSCVNVLIGTLVLHTFGRRESSAPILPFKYTPVPCCPRETFSWVYIFLLIFWKKVKHCNDDTSWVHSCSLLQRVNVSMGDFHFRVNSQHDYGICAPGWQHDCTKMSQRVHRKCTTRSFESGRIFALTRLFLALTRLFFSAKSLKIGGHARHIILNLSCRSRSNS